jgi:hypothetical protein
VQAPDHILTTTPSAAEFIAAKRGQMLRRTRLTYFNEIGQGGGRFALRHEAATWLQQHNYPWKVFMLERLRRVWTPAETDGLHGATADGDIDYRLGYWIVGKKGRARGKWVWGQYCPMIPAADLPRLIDLAISEGTIRPEEALRFQLHFASDD